MNGNYVCNKFAINFRKCCRSCNENDMAMVIKRRLCVSSSLRRSEGRDFTYKSFFQYDSRKRIWENFKLKCNEKLVILGEILTSQCNFIASQRVRRMSQMWNLYNQLYSEKTFNRIVSQFSRNLISKRRPFSILFGASLFSWENEKITDEEVQNFRQLDESLLDDMVVVRNCSNSICICELNRYRSADDHPTKPISGQGLVKKLIQDGWEAVIQKECIQVWRKAFQNSYLYEYKIMGTFYDVPARAFFAVQTDIEYRKKWDKLVIKLDVIDKENVEGGSEVMHWVMHYPYPMYSREYVYVRRAVVSPETNTMVLVSRSIEHPSCPVDNKYVRVTEYNSRMVIRPHRTYDENGFDYVLTYFDDPQAAFPAPAYNWMASSGVPDFVEKLHDAARELHFEQQKSKNPPPLPKLTTQKDPCTTGNFEYLYM